MSLSAQIVALSKIYSDGSRIGNGGQAHTTAAGHLMAGVGTYKIGVTNYTGPMIIKTDVSGDVTAGSTIHFNRTFEVFHAGNGNRVSFNTGKVIELNDGSGYAAAYSFTVSDNTSPIGIWTGIWFIIFGSNGYPAAYYPLTFDPNIYRPDQVKIAGLYQLANSTPPVSDRFVIAAEVSQGEDKRVFVVPIDAAGVTYWGGGKLYDLMYQTQYVSEIPRDIIQSPYDDDIYVVGDIGIAGQPWSTHDGWIMRLDLSNGNVSSSNLYDLGDHDAITSINLCNDPSAPGFIFSGYSQNIPGSQGKIWAMKTDGNFNVQWSNLYDDATAPNNVQNGFDAVEWNSPSGYQYYISGERKSGSRDAFMLSLDASGNPLYGSGSGGDIFISDFNSGDDESSVSIDVSPQMGPTIYCYHNDGSTTNTYLLYTCFSSVHDASVASVTPNVSNLIVNFQTPPSTVPLYYINVFDNSDVLYCRADVSQGQKTNGNTLNGGILPGKSAHGSTGTANISAINGISIYPNPVSGDMKIELGSAGNAEVLITSVQGMLVGTAEKQGDATYTFNAEGLARGVYLVEVRSDKGRQVSRFIKQ